MRQIGIAVAVLMISSMGRLTSTAAALRTGEITGQITKADGQPLIGATIVVEGTTRGASTDVDGCYEILRLDPAAYCLRISCLGYFQIEVPKVVVDSATTINLDTCLIKRPNGDYNVIRVQASRDILDRYMLPPQTPLTAREQLKSPPITTVDELLEQVAGDRTEVGGEVFVRGGRPGEVTCCFEISTCDPDPLVDGLPERRTDSLVWMDVDTGPIRNWFNLRRVVPLWIPFTPTSRPMRLNWLPPGDP